MGRFPSWLLWWACISAWIDVGTSRLKVKFGVILPEHPVSRTLHPCTTRPIAMAEEWLIAEDLMSLNWFVDSPTSTNSSARGGRTSTAAISVQFEYRDSQCSDMFGPVRAMEIYYRGAGCRRANDKLKSRSGVESLEIQAFYGPCCKYPLSPVGRYASRVWNVPVITPGGLTSGFGDKVKFNMLTRFTAPFHYVAEFVSLLLAKYGWWHLSFLFHDNTGRDRYKGYPMCYDVMGTLTAVIVERDERTSQMEIDHAALNETTESGKQENRCCKIHRETFNENYYYESDFNKIMGSVRNSSRGISHKLMSEVIACVLKVNPAQQF